jgi:hypothetical protein
MKRIIYNVFGPKGSGKDTVCRIIQNSYMARGVTVDHLSFANPLKKVVQECFGDRMESGDQIWGAIEEKEKPITSLPISADMLVRHDFLSKHTYWSGRLLLQFMGTEVFRAIDPCFWVNKMTNSISDGSGHVVISDCRFANELESLEAFPEGGPGFQLVNIRINRKGCEGDGHSSEEDQKQFHTNHSIENDAPLDVLEKVVHRILDDMHVPF